MKLPQNKCQKFLTPKILKMCDPILLTPLKMQLHYSSSYEVSGEQNLANIARSNLQPQTVYVRAEVNVNFNKNLKRFKEGIEEGK